ncbi:hypothetical protein MHBO_000535 [Bonamia ostreae]|uniref:Uncharacterized protein n=1 Tax=Bonamia ostreae TaxID=126728 RepID=A0ABV2AFX2_9EUKA
MLHRIRELAVSIESATELDSIAVKCDNLEILEIEWAPFAPSRRSLLQVFSSCTRIRSLSLWGFSVEPSQFLVAKRIEELFFYSTNLDDDYLESLSLQLCDKPLRRLKISGQTCTIRGILSVALYLPELEELNISYTKVDGDDVADLLSAKNTRGELQVLRHLKHLSIGWDQVDVVKKRLSSLRKNMVVDCSPWCKQKCCVAD